MRGKGGVVNSLNKLHRHCTNRYGFCLPFGISHL